MWAEKGTRYTVNDGSVNNWTLQVASGYGKTLTASSAGGKSYAAGNARIVAKPDAAGSNTTLTVKSRSTASWPATPSRAMTW